MANSQTDILTVLQNGVVALNDLAKAFQAVTTPSSGTITVRLTNNSSS